MTDILDEDHNHSDTELHPQSKALILHGDNDSHLYHSSTVPIRKNLNKKIKKGTYDHEKAKKLWGYHADRAAQSYTKEHGHAGQKWHELFSTKHRKAAAAHWADEHHEAVITGDSGHVHEDDMASEIVFAAMGKKPVGVNINFKEAILERSKELIDDQKCELSGKFMESLKPFKLNPAKKGMWNGWSKKAIGKAKSSAKKDGDVTREREATFALNSRNGDFK
jgi:hypothetical protein